MLDDDCDDADDEDDDDEVARSFLMSRNLC
jgi:hypothetical protein